MELDLFEYSLRNMERRRTRTWLTILAIIIGIGSFVALTTIGDSFSKSIEAELSAFGTESIVVFPGSYAQAITYGSQVGVSKGMLYDRDVELIESTAGVERVTPIIIVIRTTIGYHDVNISSPVFGVPDTLFFEDFPGYGIAEGRGFVSSEDRVAVLGYAAANTLFDKTIDVGSTVLINNERFRVVGILKEIGGTFGATDDQSIMISYKDAKDFSEGVLKEDEVSYIFVKTRKGMNTTTIAADIEESLRNSHRVREGEEDFSVFTYEFVMEQANLILSTIVIAIVLISGIALVGGSIGIMNTMFMSVLERTQELGTLKALGARNRHILLVVLMESGLLGLVGGTIGVILGLSLGYLISLLGFVEIILNPVIILGSILLSFLLGVISGYLPARRAVKLSPTEALRYE